MKELEYHGEVYNKGYKVNYLTLEKISPNRKAPSLHDWRCDCGNLVRKPLFYVVRAYTRTCGVRGCPFYMQILRSRPTRAAANETHATLAPPPDACLVPPPLTADEHRAAAVQRNMAWLRSLGYVFR